ncbi:MlaD family protein [Simplicispira psychrophila]|uniref:MlaD family protein n=1 Tax=Simplicispira psychrophila TaxID=80882 RepID=UPI000485C621|nr:MlaD family protein [Simplicispira psychrophila]
MENKSHALVAGLFVVLMAALAAGLAMWLTRDNGSYHSYELTSREGVSGLQPQAAVRYKGVAVGKVTHIGFDPQVRGNVLIRIAVEDGTPITPTTFAVLGYQGVTGLAYVLLNDAGEPQAAVPPGASGIPRLPLRSSPFSQLADQGPEILAQVQTAMRHLNDLLSDQNQQLFTQALTQMGQAAGSVNSLSQSLQATVTQRLDPALAAFPALARNADKALESMQSAGANVSVMAREMGRTAERLNAPDGALEQARVGAQTLVRAADRLNTSTLPRIERASDATARAARQFGRVAEGVSDNPQSLIYGSGHAFPGPGESGFVAPTAPSAGPGKTP